MQISLSNIIKYLHTTAGTIVRNTKLNEVEIFNLFIKDLNSGIGYGYRTIIQ